MALTADQAYATWKGTPYEAELLKNMKQQRNYDYDEYGYGQPQQSYVWNSKDSMQTFSDYVRGQEQFKLMQDGLSGTGNKDLLIDYSKFKDDPYKTTAALTRAQYDQYIQDFAPLEQRMYDMTTLRNPMNVSTEIEKAIGQGTQASTTTNKAGQEIHTPSVGRGYVQKALDNANAQTERSFARYGMTPNQAQGSLLERQQALTRGATTVDAANQIRNRLMDRDDLIMAGATPNSGRAYLPAQAD